MQSSARAYYGKPALAVILCLIAFLLAACASAPGQDPALHEWELRRNLLQDMNNWSFSGRIAVREGDEAHTARIDWEQENEHYLIKVWGTLSVGYTEISGRPGYVSLEQRGAEALVAGSPEELVYDQLGYDLPVSELKYWVRGIPAPGNEPELQLNDSQQLSRLTQFGWDIRYLGYRQFEEVGS